MALLSKEDSARVAALRAQGYSFERWPKGILVRNQDGSVVGLFQDMGEFFGFLGMTADPERHVQTSV
jgi:hypothetical protein